MAKMASLACASRFSLLKIEDDDDSDTQDTDKTQATPKSNAQNATAKKKNKKKKKDATQAQTAELRTLAFSKSGGKVTSKNSGKQTPAQKAPVSDTQWKEWKSHDEEFAADAYQQDLQKALMLSKIDLEENKTVKKALKENGTKNRPQSGKEKKKKKKDKPTPMSLDTFNQGASGDTGATTENHEGLPPPAAAPDPLFFDKVDNDVHHIIQKEKIQEEYRKQFLVENSRTQLYNQEIIKRDKEISMLRATMLNLEDELKEAKKRNKKLCYILTEAKMKDKAEVIQTVESLQQVRDELMEEVGILTEDLEKERSKVHALKNELDRHTGGRGGRLMSK